MRVALNLGHPLYFKGVWNLFFLVSGFIINQGQKWFIIGIIIGWVILSRLKECAGDYCQSYLE